MKKGIFFLACSVFILITAGILPSLFQDASASAQGKPQAAAAHRASSADTCGISGIVTDQNDDAVEKATVKLKQGSRNLAARTDSDGYYCFYSTTLKKATYIVTVSKTGYKTKRDSIKYNGSELTKDFVLELTGSSGGSTGGSSGGSTGNSGSSSLSVTPKSRTVGYGATSTSFNVTNTGTGTLTWTATVSSGGDWMSISSGSSGTNAGTITVAFSANTTSKSRGGIIRVEASGLTPKYVTVTQEAGSSTDGTSGGATGGGSSGGSTGGTTGGTTGDSTGGSAGGTSGGSTSGGTTGGASGGSTGGTTGGSTSGGTTGGTGGSTGGTSGGTTSSLTNNGNGTVSDSGTKLMWQQGENSSTYNWYVASGTYNYYYNSLALSVCKSLSLAGYSDWRLPTLDELKTLIKSGAAPTIDKTFFPNAYSLGYWSSTPAGKDIYGFEYAYYINFSSGATAYDYANSSYGCVRCVRSGQ